MTHSKVQVSDGGVYVDEDQQEDVEDDDDDSQHGQELLLRCAQVWTPEVHVKLFHFY